MKILKQKQPAAFLLGLVLILMLSLGIELLGFNGRVLLLEEGQRGMFELDVQRLGLTGLDKAQDGTFVPNGDDVGFAIDDDLYIHKLRLTTTPNTPPMHIAVTGAEKQYDLNAAFKETTVVPVMQSARDVWFSLLPDEDFTSFELAGVVIDNTITMNWLRVFLMVSLGAAALFFLVYREIAFTKLHVSFLVLALTFGINLALATPVWYGLDEHAHFVRAYQFANFNLGFDDKEELNWIADMDEFFIQTGNLNTTHNGYEEYVQWLERYDDTDYPMEKYYPTTAATYPFVPYFFAGLGILLARLAGLPFAVTFLAGRVFNVMGYALICAGAIKIAKLGKRLLFLLGLVPYALFSAGVYTADTFTVAFSILAAALYGNMLLTEDGELDWKLPAAFGVCCGLLALCKLPYAAFCALMLSVPLKKFRTNKAAWLNFALVFAVTGGISVATLLFGADKGIIQWYQEGMSIVGQVKHILFHPITYLFTMLRHVSDNWTSYLSDSVMKMGYVENMSGVWAACMLVLPAAVALLDREPGSEAVTWLPRLACLFVIAAGWVLVLTALYVSFNVVGASYIGGVQGRYFYPLLLPLLLMLKNGRLALPLGDRAWNGFCCGAAAVLSTAALVHVFSGFCM